MSVCISAKGEFGSHTMDDSGYVCVDCHEEDITGLLDDLTQLAAQREQLIQDRDRWKRDAEWQKAEGHRVHQLDRATVVELQGKLTAESARVAELEAQLERADDPCPHDPVGYVHAGPVSVHSCAACRVRVEGWVQWRTGERATFTEFPKEAGR